MKGISDLQEQVRQQEDKASKLESQATEVENNLNAILTEMERLEPKRLHLRCAAACAAASRDCLSYVSAVHHCSSVIKGDSAPMGCKPHHQC